MQDTASTISYKHAVCGIQAIRLLTLLTPIVPVGSAGLGLHAPEQHYHIANHKDETRCERDGCEIQFHSLEAGRNQMFVPRSWKLSVVNLSVAALQI